MSNYSYYFIYAAKIDFSTFSNLGEMTSQRYPSHEGNLPLKNGFNHKKMNFVSRTVLSVLKLTFPVTFSNFQTGEFFHFQYFGSPDEKRAIATRLVD